MGTGVGLLSGGLSALSDNPWVRGAGIAAPLLFHAPTLISEGLASRNGMRHLKEVGADPVLLAAARKQLGKAFGTYASQAGMDVGTALLAHGGVRGIRSHLLAKKEEAEKTAGWVEYVKLAAGAPTRGGFLMASEVPAFRAPNVYRPVHKVTPQQIVEKMGSATTPAGRLSATRRVGLPKVSAPPGPAIADVAPTFGQRLPGANKTTIGKIAHI